MRMYYEVTKQQYAMNMEIIFDIIDLRSFESVGASLRRMWQMYAVAMGRRAKSSRQSGL